jgi:hypothetical protein
MSSKFLVLPIDEDGDWMRPDEDMDVYYFQSEYAKSGRARCSVCSDPIQKGTVRLGRAIKWGGGANGYINSWSHVICTRVPEDKVDDFVAADHVYGYEELTDKEQKEITVELKKIGVPSHLESIDPNDPDFLKNTDLPEAKQPKHLLNISLLSYQKEGFGWMCSQEASNKCGGILADEMGLGKTMQAIALIVATKEERIAAARLVDAAKKIKAEEAAAIAVGVSVATTTNTSSSSSSPPPSKGGMATPTKNKKNKQKKKKDTTGTRTVAVDNSDSSDADFTPSSRRKSIQKKKKEKADALAVAKLLAVPKTFLPASHSNSIPASNPNCPVDGPTLIIVPSACLLQWNEELKRCKGISILNLFYVYYSNVIYIIYILIDTQEM